MNAVSVLPPLSVALQVFGEDYPITAGLARRGRRTAIVCRAGITREQLGEELAGIVRDEELALIRASMAEPGPGQPLPPHLAKFVLREGQTLVLRQGERPIPLLQRLA